MRTFSSLCIAVVIGVLLPISIVLLQIQRTILSPEWGVDFLRDQNVYSRVLDTALEAAPLEDFTQTLPFLDEAAIRDLLKKSIVTEELQVATEDALREAYVLIETPGKNIEDAKYEIDLTGTLARLRNEASLVIDNRIRSLPTCSASQLQKLSLEQGGIFECRPPGFEPSVLESGLDEAVAAMTTILPTTLSVRSIVSMEQLAQFNTTLHMIQRAHTFVRIFTFLSFIALGLFTILLAFLTRPISSSLKWIGFTYAISAMPVFMISLYARVTEFSSIAFVTESQRSPVLTRLANDVASAFALSLTNGVFVMSGLGVALGLGLVIMGFVLPDRPSRAKQVSVNDLNRKV